MPDADAGKLSVTTISNAFEDTPAGMHLMDQLRDKEKEMEDRLRELYGDEAVDMKRKIEAEFERKVLYGDA